MKITNADLVVRHVEGGRRNFVTLTVEAPVSELDSVLALPGVTCSVPERVLARIRAAGNTGTAQ